MTKRGTREQVFWVAAGSVSPPNDRAPVAVVSEPNI